MDIKHIREICGYLISLATFTDEALTQYFAEELDKLLPKINEEGGEK